MAAPIAMSDQHPGRRAAIALVTIAVAVLAIVAPSLIVGLAILATPLLFVALATDVDRRDLDAGFPSAFGPETRALPTI